MNAVINKLDKGKGSNDDINVNVLKLIWEANSVVILNIINGSLNLGVVLTNWKISTITPIQKVKGSINVEDLRPINTLVLQGHSKQSIGTNY